MANHPFPVDAVYSGVSLAYRNNAYIADQVLPRTKVGKHSFKYRVFGKDQYLTLPDTAVSRKGVPSQVELTFTEATDSVVDYGLDDVVPYDDVADAPEGYDPQKRAVEYLTELILLAREKRTADLVFSESSYASGYKTTLSGTSQFDNASSNPISTIKTGLDKCFLRPNVIVLGREVFSVLSTHAKIVQAFYPNSQGNGIVNAQQLAQMFEVESVLVGNAWVNGSKRGATPSLARAWGKHVALLHVNKMASTNDMPTFGLTAEYGNRVSGVLPDPRSGLRGANIIRVGESLKELIVCQELGYFIKNAIS